MHSTSSAKPNYSRRNTPSAPSKWPEPNSIKASSSASLTGIHSTTQTLIITKFVQIGLGTAQKKERMREDRTQEQPVQIV